VPTTLRVLDETEVGTTTCVSTCVVEDADPVAVASWTTVEVDCTVVASVSVEILPL